jgi:hypothetical protein
MADTGTVAAKWQMSGCSSVGRGSGGLRTMAG